MLENLKVYEPPLIEFGVGVSGMLVGLYFEYPWLALIGAMSAGGGLGRLNELYRAGIDHSPLDRSSEITPQF
jgi:hypothetical protein